MSLDKLNFNLDNIFNIINNNLVIKSLNILISFFPEFNYLEIRLEKVLKFLILWLIELINKVSNIKKST